LCARSSIEPQPATKRTAKTRRARRILAYETLKDWITTLLNNFNCLGARAIDAVAAYAPRNHRRRTDPGKLLQPEYRCYQLRPIEGTLVRGALTTLAQANLVGLGNCSSRPQPRQSAAPSR